MMSRLSRYSKSMQLSNGHNSGSLSFSLCYKLLAICKASNEHRTSKSNRKTRNHICRDNINCDTVPYVHDTWGCWNWSSQSNTQFEKKCGNIILDDLIGRRLWANKFYQSTAGILKLLDTNSAVTWLKILRQVGHRHIQTGVNGDLFSHSWDGVLREPVRHSYGIATR